MSSRTKTETSGDLRRDSQDTASIADAPIEFAELAELPEPELRFELKPRKRDAAALLTSAAVWFAGAGMVCVGLVYMIRSGLSRRDASAALDYARELHEVSPHLDE